MPNRNRSLAVIAPCSTYICCNSEGGPYIVTECIIAETFQRELRRGIWALEQQYSSSNTAHPYHIISIGLATHVPNTPYVLTRPTPMKDSVTHSYVSDVLLNLLMDAL